MVSNVIPPKIYHTRSFRHYSSEGGVTTYVRWHDCVLSAGTGVKAAERGYNFVDEEPMLMSLISPGCNLCAISRTSFYSCEIHRLLHNPPLPCLATTQVVSGQSFV
ncbi:unnamed protein product [Ectocarpus sp. 13 AM-2016]